MGASISGEALQAIAAFIPIFEAPDFQFAHNDSPLRQTGEKAFEIVGYHYDPQVYEFWEAAEQSGWLQHFDWVSWSTSEEATTLRYNPEAVRQATPEQLSRMLSMFTRMERFGDGAWLELWESGLLMRVLDRAQALIQDHARSAH